MQCWHCGLPADYLLIYLFISLFIMGDMFSPHSVNVYKRHNPTSMKQPELIFSRRLFVFCILCTVMPKALSL